MKCRLNITTTRTATFFREGTGIARKFIDREYETYVQDSWKVKKNFTVTAGLRVSLFPALYEANGIQTSSNIPLGDWFNIRGGLAETGQSQALAPELKFNLIGTPGSRGLYPFQHTFRRASRSATHLMFRAAWLTNSLAIPARRPFAPALACSTICLAKA